MCGTFLTVDGLDGSGKSTVIENIENHFKTINRDYLITKEPGSPHNEACMQMRKIILDPDLPLSGDSELFLLLSDRCQHVANVIKPALEKGKIVLSDRYYDSTYAYQGFGRRSGDPHDLYYVNFLNTKATLGVIPNLSIFLLVDPEVGLKRISQNEFGKKDAFEEQDLAFHKKVYNGFMDLYEKSKEVKNIYSKEKSRHIEVVDTTHISKEEVSKVVIDMIDKKLSQGD